MCATDLRRSAQRGLSIVELMVAIVISLLVALAAANSAIVFTAMQRQGLGAGGAIISSATTLASLKEDTAQAGLGFFSNNAYLCNALNLSVGTKNLSQSPFSPLRIVRENGQDRIDIVYASVVAGGANATLSAPSDLKTAQLNTYLPANPPEAVLLAPQSSGDACTMRTATANTPGVGLQDQLVTFAATGQHNQVAFANTYGINARAVLIGALQWHRYSVVNGNLQLEQPMVANGTPAVLVRNVVAFRTRIGVTDGTSTGITSWVAPDAVATGGTWGQLLQPDIERARALRVTLITRSTQPEQPDKNGVCQATLEDLKLFDDVNDPLTPPNVGSTSWKCYRYRAAEVVIPLRNWIAGIAK